jgi:hypothetical protein
MKVAIPILIFCLNFFRKKRLGYEYVDKTYLVYESTFDKNIFDYCAYIRAGLLKELPTIGRRSIFFIRVNPSILFRLIAPCYSIFVQVEHVLVKPGGRDSDGFESGALLIPGVTTPTRYLARLIDRELLKKFDFIVDYSRINLTNIQGVEKYCDLQDKLLYISPSLYKLSCASNDVRRRNFIAITNFGNSEQPRRKRFLETMRAKEIPIQNIQTWYEDAEELYARTRILVNIRQTDHHDTLEELRVLPALRSGVIVISELAPYKELTRYSEFIIWGALDELPEIIRHVQENYEATWSSIFGVSKFAQRMNRLEQCNQLTWARWSKKMRHRLT